MWYALCIEASSLFGFKDLFFFFLNFGNSEHNFIFTHAGQLYF